MVITCIMEKVIVCKTWNPPPTIIRVSKLLMLEPGHTTLNEKLELQGKAFKWPLKRALKNVLKNSV